MSIHRSSLEYKMKFSVLLLLVVCWANAAPKHESHNDLPKIGAVKHEAISIVGSKTSPLKKYPYNAAVLQTNNNLLGGAAIIDKRWVLTAGWNTYGQSASSLQVRVGSDNALKGGQLLQLAKMIPHPNYTASDWDWDVALLKTKKDIEFGDQVKAIKVSENLPKNKSPGVVTGWGSKYTAVNADTDKLQMLKITIYSRDYCLKKWWDSGSLNPRAFCAYKAGCGPCSSDFGDPLVQKKKVVGMYLGGYGCAVDYYPGLYSALAKFKPWIDDTVKKNSEPEELDDSNVLYYGDDDNYEEDGDEWEEEE